MTETTSTPGLRPQLAADRGDTQSRPDLEEGPDGVAFGFFEEGDAFATGPFFV